MSEQTTAQQYRQHHQAYTAPPYIYKAQAHSTSEQTQTQPLSVQKPILQPNPDDDAQYCI